MSKNILVLGASEKPHRFSNKAIRSLLAHDYPVYAIGSRPGKVENVSIQNHWDSLPPIHTICLYLGPARQAAVLDSIIHLRPERIICNPGTENPELELRAQEAGIRVIYNCTLVMLAGNTFLD